MRMHVLPHIMTCGLPHDRQACNAQVAMETVEADEAGVRWHMPD